MVISRKPNILLIGPITNIDKGLIGGATISFGLLCEELKHQQYNIKIINTQVYSSLFSTLINAIVVFTAIVRFGMWSDVVMLNVSRGGTKYIAPIVYINSKIFRYLFIFRPFGGNINEYTAHFGKLSTWIFEHTTLRADLVLLQTQALMAHYADLKINDYHFPTARKNSVSTNRNFNKKFIYLGFINEYKGIKHIKEAVDQLGSEYTVHAYGPIKDDYSRTLIENDTRIYKGILRKDEVSEVLNHYDVLILPTFYEGEGYPGVIIEAYASRMPVITTQWMAIPEIVRDKETGLLIEPKSTEELLAAIRFFDNTNYADFSKNAYQYFCDTFEIGKVVSSLMKEVNNLLQSK